MEEYPSDRQIEETINEYIGLYETQKILRDNFNFFVCTHRTKTIADIARRIKIGNDDADDLFRATKKAHPKKSTGFTIETEMSGDDLISDLNEAKRTKKEFGKKSVKVEEVEEKEDQVEVEFSYAHKNPGKIDLLSEEEKKTSVSITETDNESEKRVVQDYEMIDEFYALREFFKGYEKQKEEKGVELQKTDIVLQKLPLPSRIDLIDKILDYDHDEWRLDDVKGITINKGEEIKEVEDEELEGISEAALSGVGLRTNNFVQKCEEEGFYFNSVTILYQHKTDPKQVVLSIEFKGKPKYSFDINIKAEFENIDGEKRKTSFDRNFELKIRNNFRDMVMELYKDKLEDVT